MLRILAEPDLNNARTLVEGICASALETSRYAIRPPGLVVLKPNWVQEGREDRADSWEQVITSPQITLGLAEGMAARLAERGTLAICDAPNTYASFEAIVRRGGLAEALIGLRRKHPGVGLELLDLRREVWMRKEGVVVERRPNDPDPRGYVRFDLGRDSMLWGHRGEGRYYGADYDTVEVNKHHRGDAHEYLLSGTAVQADLFLNLPKLKTHGKTGITGCLKNLVGINGDKNWLPHHTEGSPEDGGDEFPRRSVGNRVERKLKRAGREIALGLPGLGTWIYRKMRNAGQTVLGDSTRVVRNGNWHGNDTCWRMVLDLNRALLFGNPDGTMREAGQRKPYLAIVDGIVGGEGDGPLCPDPVKANVIVAGTDPAAVDAVCCKLMGFDPMRIPMVRNAFEPHRWPIATCRMEDIEVSDERVGRTIPLREVQAAAPCGFRTHFGWGNVIEEGMS